MFGAVVRWKLIGFVLYRNFWFEALVVVKVFKPDILEGMDEDTDFKIAFNPAITQHNFCLLYNQKQLSRTPCSQLSASPSLSGLFSFQSCIPHYFLHSQDPWWRQSHVVGWLHMCEIDRSWCSRGLTLNSLPTSRTLFNAGLCSTAGKIWSLKGFETHPAFRTQVKFTVVPGEFLRRGNMWAHRFKWSVTELAAL